MGPAVITFDSSLLLGYYQAKTAGQAASAAASAGASNSSSSSSTTGKPAVPSSPWTGVAAESVSGFGARHAPMF